MKPLNLHEYAMNYLARYNNTEQGLIRVLNAKIHRWAMKAIEQGMDEMEIEHVVQTKKQDIPAIITKVKKLGIINDHAFAEYKVSNLIRSGRSQKVIQMKLQQKGIASIVIQSILDQYQNKDVELLAALIYARKRAIGPFRRMDKEYTLERKQKEQQSFVRGGFSFSIINRVISMNDTEAEEQIDMLRSVECWDIGRDK